MPANDALAKIHEEADKLNRAILTRRRRKCIAQDAHTDGGECPRCGL